MSRESSTTDVPRGRRSVDFLLSVLADEQRREILRYFQQAEDSVASLEALADHLVDAGAADDREREYVHVRLHHAHLPKLAETTAIEYEPHSRRVRYHGHPELETLLEAVDSLESATSSSPLPGERS